MKLMVGSKSIPGKVGMMPKNNQDSFLIDTNFLEDCDCKVFSVFDGHGTFGHRVSKFLKDNLHKKLYANLRSSITCDKDYSESK